MKMRNKLIATAVMLVISFVMMSTASFAWFTISTAPEIKGIDTQVVVNENLEIALAADGTNVPELPVALSATGNYYTWGNVVDLGSTKILTGADTGANEYDTFMQNVVLRPASFSTDKFTAPTYGNDGRVNDADGLTLKHDTDGYGFGVIKDEMTTPNVYGYYVDFWVRSNVGGNLNLATTDTNRVADDTDTEGGGSVATSENKTFQNNMNVVFSIVATAENGAKTVTAVKNGRTYVKATNAGTAAAGVGSALSIDSANTNGIATLTANTAYLVRVYVYLDGANMTNADASTYSDASNATLSAISGSINLQFTIGNVDKPMVVDIPALPSATG